MSHFLISKNSNIIVYLSKCTAMSGGNTKKFKAPQIGFCRFPPTVQFIQW